MSNDLESKCEQLHQAFVRSLQMWHVVTCLQRVAPGLAATVPQQLLEYFRERLSKDDVAAFSGLSAESRQRCAETIATDTVADFEKAVGAACMVFAHTATDSAVLAYCKIDASLRPFDWKECVSRRQVAIDDVMGNDADEILKSALGKYLADLERESLPKKVAVLIDRTRPPATLLRAYDVEKLKRIDHARHDLVHGQGPTKPLADLKSDLDQMFALILILPHWVSKKNELGFRISFDKVAEHLSRNDAEQP